jgi:hypothetical protein
MENRELPHQLRVNEDYEIVELLTPDGVERVLLSPSKCYLNDPVVQLEAVINEIVKRYNGFKPTLLQLHHQNKKDFTSEMVSQSAIWCNLQMENWWKEATKEHPLPEGYQWMVCDEESKYFVKCAKYRQQK